jgi:hypothetical protein
MANYCTLNVQAKINDLYERKAWNPHTGVLDMAFSPANGAAVQAQMIKKDGMNSVYSITYPAAVCSTPIAIGDFVCTDAGAATDSTTCDTFNGFDGYSSGWQKTTVESFRDLGSMNIQDVISHQVSQQMYKIKSLIDLAVLLSINTAAGCIETGTTTRTIALTSVNGAPVFNTDVDIAADFMDAGFSVAPILLGNRQLLKYVNGIKNGTANQYGQQIGSIDTFEGAFYDKNINATNTAPATAGNEVMFAILPGLVNVLSWSANAGIFASRNGQTDWETLDPMALVNTNNSTFMYTVLQDPSSGMLFDFNVVFNEKCKYFEWEVRSYYKTKILDLTGCKDSCFNGIIKYDICPVTPVDCLTPVE